MGIYSASKFALEGYTEALRLEVKPFNIHVSQVEAGFLKSPMMEHRQVAGQQIKEYDPWRQRAFKAIGDHEEKGLGYVVGQQAKVLSRLRQFLPEGVFEKGARRTFCLDNRK